MQESTPRLIHENARNQIPPDTLGRCFARASHLLDRYDAKRIRNLRVAVANRFVGIAAKQRNSPYLTSPNSAIHNYRWRLGLAEGDAKYDDLDKRLAESPVITVPTITLEGDANGAPHPEPSAYAKKFSGQYEHRTITGGIGHNLPQEAPQAFAQAIVDIAAS